MSKKNVTVQQCRRCVPRKGHKLQKSAKCAMAHEQADDKADVVLLNGYGKLANVYQLFPRLSSLSVTAKKRGDAKNPEYWYVTD